MMVRLLKVSVSRFYDWLKRGISKRATNSDHNRPIYDNLLKQEFSMTNSHLAWSSDITYIWTAEGWLYLAALKDLCTKQVVGYSLSERMTADLVCNALSMAIRNHKPPQCLIVHSDTV